MIDPNINPHEQAVEELLKWEAQGIRHCFDPEYVVMEDIYPKKFNKKEQNDK